MMKATFPPLQNLPELIRTHENHDSTTPFPTSGTLRNLPQIVRSIPAHFPKVKENGGQIFGYPSFRALTNALTNLPSSSARCASESAASDALAPLAATSETE